MEEDGDCPSLFFGEGLGSDLTQKSPFVFLGFLSFFSGDCVLRVLVATTSSDECSSSLAKPGLRVGKLWGSCCYAASWQRDCLLISRKERLLGLSGVQIGGKEFDLVGCVVVYVAKSPFVFLGFLSFFSGDCVLRVLVATTSSDECSSSLAKPGLRVGKLWGSCCYAASWQRDCLLISRKERLLGLSGVQIGGVYREAMAKFQQVTGIRQVFLASRRNPDRDFGEAAIPAESVKLNICGLKTSQTTSNCR
ncbi:hypothetical protein ACLB2K_027441 [Fragaria x ananassa]